jgi:Holliday junction resolvase RusA-like endonuclease
MRINIKALSINEAFKGKRYRTDKYDSYIYKMMLLLPKLQLCEPPYTLLLKVGYSSPNADIDNFLKPFIDCLQKKYGFNDKLIYKLIVEKSIVKKTFEFIDFEIEPYLHDKTPNDKLSDKF